jgi:ribonuclease BN (tRNA processing enzyme)
MDLHAMTITITILGSGTAIPVNGRAPASVLWQRKDDADLFEIGPGTLLRLREQGINFQSLRNIFLTHLHSDHTLDLVTLIQANDCIPDPGRQEPLTITGCKGTQSFFAQLMEAFPGISPVKYPFRIDEKTEGSWQAGDVKVKSALTGHTSSSLAYRIESDEGVFVYSGDAVLSDALVDLCTNADLAVCDCSYPASIESPDHMNTTEVGHLAARAGIKTLVPTHFYPQVLAADIKGEIRQHYSGQILPAIDGMVLRIPSRKHE